MPYGNLNADVVQSSTANTPVQFNDGNGTQVGTLCRAWVNFNGVTTITVRASFNVSSVVRNGTGDYTVNFTNAFSDANYGFAISASRSNITNQANVASPYTSAPTTSAFRFSTNTTGANDDSQYCAVSFFR